MKRAERAEEGGEKMMEPEKTEALMEMCVPIAKKLQKEFHPHVTVVIEDDYIRVEETIAGKVIEYEMD